MGRFLKIISAVVVALVLLAAIIVITGPKWSSVNNNAGDNDGDTDDSGDHNGPPQTPTDSITVANLTVDFIDVGQGDSELIRTPDNKTILIDTGPSTSVSDEISFLSSHTYGIIDVLVLTHPDADHIGNAVAILDAFTVKSVYQSGYISTSQTYKNLQSRLADADCPVYDDAQISPGDHMAWSSNVSFQIMSIDADAASSNDASIVIRMTYGSMSFLFMGDASSNVESWMVGQYGSGLDSAILKVGHHGSSTSTSDAFLTAVAPMVAIIEVATDNQYGHPTSQTLNRLSAHDVMTYRTDLGGDIEITWDGTSFFASVQR